MAATPALVFSSEDTPDEIDLGESFELEISVAEYSGQGDHGGISVSFPGLTNTGGNSSSYDSTQGKVETISYTNGVSMVTYHDKGDQIHEGTDTSTSAADYLLVESDDDDWPSRTGSDYEWRTLKLRVTPKQTGEFEVYYRVWLCGDGYQECDRRPRSEHSEQEDQQRWAVAVITVDVTNPVSPTGDFARDPDEDFDTLDDAGNDNPRGIWSDGTTMWVVDDGDSKIYAYILNTKARDSAKDFNTLDATGNDYPTGIWSDGTTMWVADGSDDKLYAYNMATKARDSDKDFNTLENAENERPEGIWSDGTTMWVADASDDKIYAYSMDSKARVSSKDFNTLENAENERPEGIWSDGTTMWVADYSDDKIYAYNLSTKARVSSKDFDTLDAARNDNPTGLWSDRTTVWVADYSDDKIYAYNAPEMAPAPAISNRAPSVSKVTPTSASVSLYVGNSQTFEASANDPDDNLTSWDWSIDGTSENNGRFGFWPFYNSPTGTVTKEFTHTFSSAGTYTVEATFTDKEGDSDSQEWMVQVVQETGDYERDSDKDFHTLDAAGNEGPEGIWSDNTTMWVADHWDDKIYAYNLSTKARDSAKDFNTLAAAGNEGPAGIWSDNTTMWVADYSDDKIYAYNLSTKARDSAKDFNTLAAAGNEGPEGIWSDNTTMWVADHWDDKIYAYDLSTKARDFGKDFNTLDAAGNEGPAGIWSDGTTMWVADYSDDKIYAYDLSTKARDFGKDFNTLDAAGNERPAGIWSDGTTMWVADYSDDKIYAYDGPGMATPTQPEPTNSPPVISNATPSPSSTVTLTTGDSQTFEATVIDPDNNLKRYEWFVNDQSEDSGVWRLFLPTGSVDRSFSHTFSTAGPYTVKATFTDDDGESASVTWDVTVRQVTPTIQVTQSISDTSVHVNESVTVRLRMRRLSGSSGNGGITVSFPDLDQANSSGSPASSYDSADGSVSTTSYTNGTSKVHYFASGYSPIHNQDGTTGTARYLIVESDDTDWPDMDQNSDYRTLELSFTPKKQGTYEIYYRFWLCGNQYDDCRRLPESIREDPQQGWHVGVYTITVTPPSTGTPRAEITSCGASPENPTVKDEWVPVATVTNHSYSGLLSALFPTEFYVQFTIKDPTRGLAHPKVESTKEAVSVGSSHTFRGELVESWPDDDKEQRVEDGSHQLSLFPLKWFPGQIDVKCELKAEDHVFGDDMVDEDTGKVAVPDFQRSSADAKITTCAPSRQPVLSGEEPTFQANTMYEGRNKGLTRFAVEYWVHYKELRVHHSGDDVEPDSSLDRNSSSGWMTEEWERPENWIDLDSQNLPTGTYVLDCALWGHLVSPAYKRLRSGNRGYEALVAAVKLFGNPIQFFIERFVTGSWTPAAEVQQLEREISKREIFKLTETADYSLWTDYSLQGLVSTEFSVVEARWGTAGLGIERETETLLHGRERIRVRVSREETENRVGGRIPAPNFHVNGPELEQIKEATRCGEGDQDHGKYLSLCWETTFDIPVNDTINEREYAVRVESHFIGDDQTNSFTVVASPDAAGLRALYDTTGGPNWVNKNGWLSSDPIDDWYGVDTNAGGRVVKLDLRGNGLQGPLPSDLKDTLPFLHTLYLEGNGGLTECVREDLLDVLPNGLDSLDLPTCEDTCAWGGALPDPNNQGLVADCEALLAARDTLTAGQPSGRLNWSAREHIDTWRGVVREGNPERVIKLEIEQPPGLWGYLSRELAKLSSLQVLTLPNAGLQGEIPKELKDLASLHTLKLQGNQLTGGIPRELSGLTSLHTLDLSDNDLNRPIPGKLTELVNLQTLRLDGNRFSGCIPEGLRGVASNDLGDLGLPFCDVLLSGLTISPGVLTPRFESGRTDYTAEVGVSRITVTPTNSHNATFMFLVENDATIPDADDTLAGHQVELGPGVTTIGVKVLSQDAGASHTYTIQVSRGGSLPDAPAIVVPITPGAASLTVSWTAPSGETDITSYDLRYIEGGSQPDANWTVVESVWTSGSGSLNYQITGLANGTQYDVQVRTVNATGHGFWSAIAAGTPRTTPGAPAINSLVPGDGALAVEWSAPATDGGADVTGYDLRFIRSDAPDKGDANWTVRSSIWSSGALRYDLGGLTNGVSYDVLVRGVNAVGHGPWSPAATGTPRTTPGAPAIDSLIPGDGALAVEWSDPATDGGADVTGYDLRFIRSDAPDKADANWTVRSGIWSSGALRYDLGGLTDGVGYDVQVRAANAAGHGQWSDSITATPQTMPTAPAVVSVAAGDGALAIAWTAPADTGGLNIQGYDVRYIPAEENSPGATWTEEQDVWTLGSLEHTITGLTNGVRYDLELRAVTSAGDGPWSSTFSGTPRTTPDVPIVSLITPDGSTLTVAWDAPANTGGSAITSYDLRYIESGAVDKADANWTVVDDAWATGSGALSYQISGLTGGTQYDVQVRAVTAAGDGPWSAAATGTPATWGAIRSFSPPSAAPAGEVVVMITASGYGGFGAVTETLPPGFSYVTSSLEDDSVTVNGREVRFRLLGETDFTYTVTAPGAAGTYSFSGVLKNSNSVEQPVGGVSGIMVEAAALSVSIISTLTAGANFLTVTWSAPVGSGGPAISAYDVRYIRTSADEMVDANWTVVDDAWAAGSGALSHPISGLTGGTQYDVQVRAVTAAGNGPWSAAATGTPATWGAIRSFSPPSAAPAGEVVVMITASGYGGFGAVTETLPPGFSYVTSSLEDDSVTVNGREVTFRLLGETDFTYTVVAPGAAGTYSFSGVLRNSEREDVPVGGALTIAVAAGDPLIVRYDANGNGMIEKSEVIAAINDYLFGEGDEAISKSEVIKLINLYLFG